MGSLFHHILFYPINVVDGLVVIVWDCSCNHHQPSYVLKMLKSQFETHSIPLFSIPSWKIHGANLYAIPWTRNSPAPVQHYQCLRMNTSDEYVRMNSTQVKHSTSMSFCQNCGLGWLYWFVIYIIHIITGWWLGKNLSEKWWTSSIGMMTFPILMGK